MEVCPDCNEQREGEAIGAAAQKFSADAGSAFPGLDLGFSFPRP